VEIDWLAQFSFWKCSAQRPPVGNHNIMDVHAIVACSCAADVHHMVIISVISLDERAVSSVKQR
jgi:hypothetical protein